MAKKQTPAVTQASVKELLTKYNKPGEKIKLQLTPEGQELEQKITSDRRLFCSNSDEFKKSMWSDSIIRTLDGFVDLIQIALMAPHLTDISKRPAYKALQGAFYRTMGSLIIWPDDTKSAFALERGTAEFLKEQVTAIHLSGKLSCRIRFVKAKNVPETETTLYDEITIKFGAEYTVRLTALHYRY